MGLMAGIGEVHFSDDRSVGTVTRDTPPGVASTGPQGGTMPSAVGNVLVVGAGSAGCVAASLLARAGVRVEVVEIHDDVTAIGSGITVQGNALRVLREIGAWDAAQEAGYPFHVTGIRLHDGTVLAELEDIKTGGPDLPATMGMERKNLARILVDAARGHGASFRFGTTVTTFTDTGNAVEVSFSDGTTGRFDLVIGADGIHSAVRSMIGIRDEPEPTGMAIFRVFTERPPSVVRTDLCYSGPCYIAGYCPTGENSLYAYLVEDKQDRSDLSPEERLAYMRSLAEAYHGPWDDIRELMTDPETVHYTWFERMLLPPPWWRGRVVLIGDAAHTCPPTLAQGAAQAMEDALVLAESLLAHTELDPALQAFMDRRFDRARTVVDASVQVGQWMLDHDPDADIPGLIMRTLGALCAPA
jgi:2-polyprenyl-6-methoxyphenol hydroxylase-like FAD-dependent oxidoreductase